MQPEDWQELLAKAAEMGAASALAKLQREPALQANDYLAGTSAVGNAQPVGHSTAGEYSDELAAFTAEPPPEDLHQEVCGLST